MAKMEGQIISLLSKIPGFQPPTSKTTALSNTLNNAATSSAVTGTSSATSCKSPSLYALPSSVSAGDLSSWASNGFNSLKSIADIAEPNWTTFWTDLGQYMQCLNTQLTSSTEAAIQKAVQAFGNTILGYLYSYFQNTSTVAFSAYQKNQSYGGMSGSVPESFLGTGLDQKFSAGQEANMLSQAYAVAMGMADWAWVYLHQNVLRRKGVNPFADPLFTTSIVAGGKSNNSLYGPAGEYTAWGRIFWAQPGDSYAMHAIGRVWFDGNGDGPPSAQVSQMAGFFKAYGANLPLFGAFTPTQNALDALNALFAVPSSDLIFI